MTSLHNLNFKKIGLLACLFISLSVHAQESGQKAQKNSFALGGGVALSNNIRVNNNLADQNRKTLVNWIPAISLKYDNFAIRGNRVLYTFHQSWWMLRAMATYGGDEYRSEGIGKRHNSFFGGLDARLLFLSLGFKYDLQGRSHGMESYLSVGKRVVVDNMTFAARVGLKHYSANYVDYYFGVRSNEVTSDRGFYEGKSSTSTFINFSPSITFYEALTFRMAFGYERMGDEIYNSPTVSKRDKYSGVFMITWEL